MLNLNVPVILCPFCLSLSLVMADGDRKIFARPEVVGDRSPARLERTAFSSEKATQRVKTKSDLNCFTV